MKNLILLFSLLFLLSSGFSYAETSTDPIADSAITTKVKAAFVAKELFSNEDVTPMGVTVETVNGVVYLSGTVDNAAQEHNAINIARSVSGIKGVKSSIVVAK